jgi:hypothetical protein
MELATLWFAVGFGCASPDGSPAPSAGRHYGPRLPDRREFDVARGRWSYFCSFRKACQLKDEAGFHSDLPDIFDSEIIVNADFVCSSSFIGTKYHKDLQGEFVCCRLVRTVVGSRGMP